MLNEGELHWFPMRIRHSSLPRLELMLDRLSKQQAISDVYAPLGFIKTSMTKMDFAPYLLNYIFVQSTFAEVAEVKSNREWFEPLRFVMHPAYDEGYDVHDEVLTISDREMADYQRMTAEANDQIVFLRDLKYACKPSWEVQIIEGPFAGIIGHLKRIKGQRCVVMPIGMEQAPAVVNVQKCQLRYLTEAESRRLADEERKKREEEEGKIRARKEEPKKIKIK